SLVVCARDPHAVLFRRLRASPLLHAFPTRRSSDLAYSVYAFAHGYVDGGGVGVYAATDPEKVRALIPVIAGEMKALAEKADEDEVARARAQLKAGLLMSLESPTSRMDQIGRQLLIFDRVLTVSEMTDAIA